MNVVDCNAPTAWWRNASFKLTFPTKWSSILLSPISSTHVIINRSTFKQFFIETKRSNINVDAWMSHRTMRSKVNYLSERHGSISWQMNNCWQWTKARVSTQRWRPSATIIIRSTTTRNRSRSRSMISVKCIDDVTCWKTWPWNCSWSMASPGWSLMSLQTIEKISIGFSRNETWFTSAKKKC